MPAGKAVEQASRPRFKHISSFGGAPSPWDKFLAISLTSITLSVAWGEHGFALIYRHFVRFACFKGELVSAGHRPQKIISFWQ